MPHPTPPPDPYPAPIPKSKKKPVYDPWWIYTLPNVQELLLAPHPPSPPPPPPSDLPSPPPPPASEPSRSVSERGGGRGQAFTLQTHSSHSRPPTLCASEERTKPHPTKKGGRGRRRVPNISERLYYKALAIIERGAVLEDPPVVPVLQPEFALRVVGLRGEVQAWYVSGWESTQALRSKLAKAYSIFPTRHLRLFNPRTGAYLPDGTSLSELALSASSPPLLAQLQSAPPILLHFSLSPPPPLPSPRPLLPQTAYPPRVCELPFPEAYAHILAVHFPPEQGFTLHTQPVPGIPTFPGIALAHPRAPDPHTPLVVLSSLPEDLFGIYVLRAMHITHLLRLASSLPHPNPNPNQLLFLISAFGPRFRAVRYTGLHCEPVRMRGAGREVPLAFPRDCASATWAGELCSAEGFGVMREMAEEIKALIRGPPRGADSLDPACQSALSFMPSGRVEDEEKPVLRLPPRPFPPPPGPPSAIRRRGRAVPVRRGAERVRFVGGSDTASSRSGTVDTVEYGGEGESASSLETRAERGGEIGGGGEVLVGPALEREVEKRFVYVVKLPQGP